MEVTHPLRKLNETQLKEYKEKFRHKMTAHEFVVEHKNMTIKTTDESVSIQSGTIKIEVEPKNFNPNQFEIMLATLSNKFLETKLGL